MIRSLILTRGRWSVGATLERELLMSILRLVVAASVTAGLAMVAPRNAVNAFPEITAEQGAAPAGQGAAGGGRQGGGRAGGAAGATDGKLIGGTLTPAKPDARGWGWQVKASINPATPRPFYNKAKELLFQDKQITSYTISTYNPEFYCEVAKHFDYTWFEMQHSTMSYDEVR